MRGGVVNTAHKTREVSSGISSVDTPVTIEAALGEGSSGSFVSDVADYKEDNKSNFNQSVSLNSARLQGYEGDACGDCGNFTLVRNGTCMKCNTCGATSGCS